MTDTATRLNQDTTDANAGHLLGNRMFWDNDYMVRIVQVTFDVKIREYDYTRSIAGQIM